MIDLLKEKLVTLSSKDRYDILSFAIESADDGGFISSFVFERALYVYAALMFAENEVEKEKIRKVLSLNPLAAWDKLVEKGTIQEMMDEHEEDLNALADEAWIWFEEYVAYAHSARGLLNTVEELSGGIVQNAAKTLQDSMQKSGAADVLNIADDWGMNRGPRIIDSTKQEIVEDESLFN